MRHKKVKWVADCFYTATCRPSRATCLAVEDGFAALALRGTVDWWRKVLVAGWLDASFTTSAVQTRNAATTWHLLHTTDMMLILTRRKVLWQSTNPRESAFVANTWQHFPHLLFCGPLVSNFLTELFCKQSPFFENNRRFTEFLTVTSTSLYRS